MTSFMSFDIIYRGLNCPAIKMVKATECLTLNVKLIKFSDILENISKVVRMYSMWSWTSAYD